MTKRVWIVGVALLTAAVLLIMWISSTGRRDPNKAPPGVADHLPGATAQAIANRSGGTCQLISRARLTDALGGTTSPPTADNMTPGLDRCSWTSTGSKLAKGTLLIIAQRSEFAPPKPQVSRTGTKAPKVSNTRAIIVSEIDPKAVWDPQALSLSWPGASGSLSLQVVANHNESVNPDIARAALVALAQDIHRQGDTTN